MKKRKNKTRWYTIALALGAVLMIALLILALMDKPKAQKKAEILERAARLEQERDILTTRRDVLQQNYLKQINHPATEHIVFLDLNERLYTDAYPMLEKIGICGSMGLSEGNFPGDPGKITREEFDELLELGWDYCVVCGESEDFPAWDREITLRLEEAGLAKPETVLFEENAFDISLREDILRCGYHTAVHHGEGRLSLIGKDSSGELWLTGAQFWNYQGVKIDIEELVRFKGDKCFTVRFTGGYEKFIKDSFASMLEYIDPYLSNETLLVTSFENARGIHDSSAWGGEMTEEQFEQQKTELDERIQTLNEQIQAIYDEWNEEK